MTCGTLEQPEHATLKMSGHHYMDTATYTCGKGFNKMIGNKKRQCLANGTWSGASPICSKSQDMQSYALDNWFAYCSCELWNAKTCCKTWN